MVKADLTAADAAVLVMSTVRYAEVPQVKIGVIHAEPAVEMEQFLARISRRQLKL